MAQRTTGISGLLVPDFTKVLERVGGSSETERGLAAVEHVHQIGTVIRQQEATGHQPITKRGL